MSRDGWGKRQRATQGKRKSARSKRKKVTYFSLDSQSSDDEEWVPGFPAFTGKSRRTARKGAGDVAEEGRVCMQPSSKCHMMYFT